MAGARARISWWLCARLKPHKEHSEFTPAVIQMPCFNGTAPHISHDEPTQNRQIRAAPRRSIGDDAMRLGAGYFRPDRQLVAGARRFAVFHSRPGPNP